MEQRSKKPEVSKRHTGKMKCKPKMFLWWQGKNYTTYWVRATCSCRTSRSWSLMRPTTATKRTPSTWSCLTTTSRLTQSRGPSSSVWLHHQLSKRLETTNKTYNRCWRPSQTTWTRTTCRFHNQSLIAYWSNMKANSNSTKRRTSANCRKNLRFFIISSRDSNKN